MKYAFKDIASNCTEKRIPTEEDRLTYIGLEHLDSRKLAITRYGSDVPLKGEKLVMKKGDILFGKRNTYLKRVAIAPFDGLFSAHGMVLRPNEKVISKEFFPFFLSSDYFLDEAIRISVGSLSPTVNWKDLRDLVFEIPDFEKQHELALFLSSANELKESYEKMIAATDEMVKSQFIEMFRTAPKEHVHLKDIATYSIGLTYKPENVKPSGIPVLRSGNIQEESLDFGDLVRVDSSIPDTLLLQDGDILMCSRNGSAHLVGKVARIRQLPEPMTFGAFMTVIRSEYMDYLFLFFQSDGFRQQISYGKSSTMNQITQKMLDQITLDLPSKTEIKKLSPLLEQADKSKFELKQAIEKIDKVMRALMQ